MNCVLSGYRQIHILTQYHAQSLNRHRMERWNCLSSELGEYIHLVPPRAKGTSGGYRSTADAVYQNLRLIDRARPDAVLVLSGDHVYRADYRKFVDAHLAREADLTLMTGDVEPEEASAFGCVDLSPQGRIVRFAEKPIDPTPWARNGKCPINLGVYCFQTRFLVRALIDDARRDDSTHDFGRDLIPRELSRGYVAACPLDVVTPDRTPYWRDVGSIDSYFQSNMDLLGACPRFELGDPRWSACSRFHEWVPSRCAVTARIDGRAVHGTNLIGSGVRIENANVVNCIISNRARISGSAQLEECILFPGAHVGRGARLRRAIVEEGVRIPDGARIGYEGDGAGGHVTSPGGIIVVSNHCHLPSFEEYGVQLGPEAEAMAALPRGAQRSVVGARQA
jgi:glucose-1-phosphate adenylyltransferase